VYIKKGKIKSGKDITAKPTKKARVARFFLSLPWRSLPALPTGKHMYLGNLGGEVWFQSYLWPR